MSNGRTRKHARRKGRHGEQTQRLRSAQDARAVAAARGDVPGGHSAVLGDSCATVVAVADRSDGLVGSLAAEEAEAGEVIAQLWVPGPFPGMNEIVAAAKSGRCKGNGYARQKAVWTDCVASYARSLRVGTLPSPVSLSCVWVEPDARRDPDNVMAAVKFALDGLVQARVIAGDGRKHIASIRHEVITGKVPGVQIKIESSEGV
jgi:Holliday junction resolvase RusA-like endonuclease